MMRRGIIPCLVMASWMLSVWLDSSRVRPTLSLLSQKKMQRVEMGAVRVWQELGGGSPSCSSGSGELIQDRNVGRCQLKGARSLERDPLDGVVVG